MSKRQAGLGFILVTLFLDILGIGLVVPILPRLVSSFVGDDTALASRYFGWFVAVYAVMQFVCSPILGSLSDRFGRRAVLLTSLFGAGLDYLLLWWAPSLAWLFVGRVIAGVTGASIGTATAYIADVSAPEKRAQNFGLVGMAFGLGFIAGPAVGGLLGGTDLRLPFLVAAGLTGANALYGLFVLPESLPKEQRRPFSWSRANPVGTIVGLARYPVVVGLTATLFLLGVAQRSLESTWVLYTQHRFGWNVRATGLSLAVVGIGAAVVQGGLVRRVIPKFGERKTLVVGMLFSITAFALYGLATQGWLLYAILPIGALGGVSGPAAQGLLSKAVPPNEQGMLQGGLASLMSVTQMIGPPVATELFGRFGAPEAPIYVPGAAFFMGSALMVIGLWLAVRTFARLPESATVAQKAA